MPAAFVFVLLLEFLSLENLSLILRCTNQEPTEEAQQSSQTLALGAVGPLKAEQKSKMHICIFLFVSLCSWAYLTCIVCVLGFVCLFVSPY